MNAISTCIIILTLLLAFVFGVFLFMCFFEWKKRRALSSAGLIANSKNDNYLSWLFRNGIKFLNPICEIALTKFKFLRNNIENIVVLIEEKGFVTSNICTLSAITMLSFLIAMIVTIVFWSFIAGVAVVLCLIVLLTTIGKSSVDKRISSIRNSIPDMLRSMNACFGVGYTLYQTFENVSGESKGAVKTVFKNCTNVLKTGGSISQALDEMKKDNNVPELSFLAVALDVQHQTGGSIRPVIESTKDMVEAKLELMRLLDVQTAQAKLSARIVMILPFALIAIFSIISPGFLLPFFNSLFGIVILIIAFVMQSAGIILVKKILNVEV